jgi:hypothetical protein
MMMAMDTPTQLTVRAENKMQQSTPALPKSVAMESTKTAYLVTKHASQ